MIFPTLFASSFQAHSGIQSYILLSIVSNVMNRLFALLL